MSADASAKLLTSDELFTIVYKELRRVARRNRRGMNVPLTLDTTSLVHETYLKLSSDGGSRQFSRKHFLSLASKAMRQIIVNHARDRSRLKRGGTHLTVTTLSTELAQSETDTCDLIAIDSAMTKLQEVDVSCANLAEMHLFGGINLDAIAELQGISPRTAYRHWRTARAFLIRQLELVD